VTSVSFPNDKWPDLNERLVNPTILELTRHFSFTMEDINAYNDRLPATAKAVIDQRLQELNQQREKLQALGIPIRGGEETRTYVLPAPPRPGESAPHRPPPARIPASLDPTMAESEYEWLIGVIREAGRMMTRSPEAYRGDEETRRQHLLGIINSHYPGQVYAEALNARGKTDILVRRDGHNLFIGECKIWSGASDVSSAIDQLAGYATYHDTKLGLIVFVTRQDMTRVVEAGRQALADHRLTLGKVVPIGDLELHTRVSIAGDADRRGQLRTLFIHAQA
jgi:hypothetical protein